MRKPVRGLVSLCVLAFVLLAAGATAAAPYQTKLTISDQALFWHGKVLSSGDLLNGVRSCERGRLVKLLKRRDGKDRLTGTDVSNRAGRWVIPDEPTEGIYYAKVTPRRPGAKPACAGDQSGIVFID